jgi:hypothetical protein
LESYARARAEHVAAALPTTPPQHSFFLEIYIAMHEYYAMMRDFQTVGQKSIKTFCSVALLALSMCNNRAINDNIG